MRTIPIALLVSLAGACSAPAPDEPDGKESRAPGDDTGPDDVVEDDDGTDGDEEVDVLEEELRTLLQTLEAPPTPLVGPPEEAPAQIALGEALFFDPILSGNKDVACASCHHPEHGLGDGLPLTLGTGTTGVGPARADGDHGPWIPRHAPSLFNVGEPGGGAWFWDGRVYEDGAGPASTLGPLPEGLSSALAAQALHPVLDSGEMRGLPGDIAVDGSANELSALATPEEIWGALLARIIAIQGYRDLLAAAYPETPEDAWGIAQLANALAAYQADAFVSTGSPFDAWLAGDPTALDDSEKLGALVFFGAAGCGSCHSGPLLSDGRFHNSGVPQTGPGVGPLAPADWGREGVTAATADRYAFRTAPLRNVGFSAPYMHDGVFPDLGAVVEHYADPQATAAAFDDSHLAAHGLETMRDEAHIDDLLAHLSPDLPLADADSRVGLSNLRRFLLSLDDPAWVDASDRVPDSVPSGLPVPR